MMGGHGKARWKISSLYRRSSPSSTPSRRSTPPPHTGATATSAADPPKEFVCPISGRLMADPVILPSGQTFERGCAQAFKDLGFVPPGAGDADPAELFLIPNLALRTAIHNWCDSVGVDPPQPVDVAAAVQLVSGLLLSSPCSSTSASPASSSASIRALGEPEDEAKVEWSKLNSLGGSSAHRICPSPCTPSSPSATSYFTSTTTATSTFTSSSSSSSEILSYDSHSPPKPGSSSASTPLEEEILAGLRAPQVSEQEVALRLLRSATRDGGGDNRAALCSPRILAALRPMLVSRYPALQSHAAASLVNLSLHPPNRVRIVRAGTVPAVVDALKSGHPEAQDHAAGALFSLSMDDENRAAIGVLGALPPLLHLLSRGQAEERTRRDAAMAIYYLCMSGTNRSKLVKLGAIKTLLGIVTAPPREARTLLNPALMILCNLAACGDGRAAMMDAGAVEAVVRLLRAPPQARDPAAEPKREHCVSALYGMSRGGMRFRGLAKAAGAEEALRAVVEQEEAAAAALEGDAAERERRWRLREMARRTLRAAAGGAGEDGDSVCSESDVASVDGGLYGSASEPVLRTRRSPVNAAHFPKSTRF